MINDEFIIYHLSFPKSFIVQQNTFFSQLEKMTTLCPLMNKR